MVAHPDDLCGRGKFLARPGGGLAHRTRKNTFDNWLRPRHFWRDRCALRGCGGVQSSSTFGRVKTKPAWTGAGMGEALPRTDFQTASLSRISSAASSLLKSIFKLDPHAVFLFLSFISTFSGSAV